MDCFAVHQFLDALERLGTLQALRSRVASDAEHTRLLVCLHLAERQARKFAEDLFLNPDEWV